MRTILSGWRGIAVLEIELSIISEINSAQQRNKLNECFFCLEDELRWLIAIHADCCVLDAGMAPFVGYHTHQICAFTD